MPSHRSLTLLTLLSVVLCCWDLLQAQSPPGGLVVIGIGDAGEDNSTLRATGFYVSDMYTGRHDAGKPDVLLFLGDNFIPLGLNGPGVDADGTARSLFRKFDDVFATMPQQQVHAIPGEHDYYSRFGQVQSTFFGLFTSGEFPTGISNRGVIREHLRREWTFHSGMASEMVWPVRPGGGDSAQFIFFDSALLLRTDPSQWHPALESLRRILIGSRDRQGITWRILCAHHPWYSLGEHGGYSVWNDDDSTVEYLPNCDRDSNSAGYVRNWLDPEDLCADRYIRYVDSIRSAIRSGSVKVHLILSAHDRSLQLLYEPERDRECDLCPEIQIVSGAASRTTRVRQPSPPYEFTSASGHPEDEGISLPGFVQLLFGPDRIRVIFYNSRNGDRIDMGAGRRVFWVDRSGKLLPE